MQTGIRWSSQSVIEVISSMLFQMLSLVMKTLRPTNQNICSFTYKQLRGFSPQANYTDRSTAVGEVSVNFRG
jgi:hypothetical protein